MDIKISFQRGEKFTRGGNDQAASGGRKKQKRRRGIHRTFKVSDKLERVKRTLDRKPTRSHCPRAKEGGFIFPHVYKRRRKKIK